MTAQDDKPEDEAERVQLCDSSRMAANLAEQLYRLRSAPLKAQLQALESDLFRRFAELLELEGKSLSEFGEGACVGLSEDREALIVHRGE